MLKDETGHNIIDGARWHWPAPGDPKRCGVTGCTRVLGEQHDQEAS